MRDTVFTRLAFLLETTRQSSANLRQGRSRASNPFGETKNLCSIGLTGIHLIKDDSPRRGSLSSHLLSSELEPLSGDRSKRG